MTAESHLDGERLSALVDGEAPPSDVDHAAACTECSARVRAWQEAARLVGEAPLAPAAARDAAVAAALESGRARRRPFPVWAAAAAALVLVGGGAVAAGLAADSGGTTHHTASGSTAPAAPAVTAPPGAAQTSPIVPGIPQLGDIANAQALQSRLRPVAAPSGFATQGGVALPSAEPSRPIVTRCLVQAQDAASLRGARAGYEAALTYAGRPAIVFVFLERQAVVLSTDDCTVLALVPL